MGIIRVLGYTAGFLAFGLIGVAAIATIDQATKNIGNGKSKRRTK